MNRVIASSLCVLACGLASLGCASPPVPVLHDGLETPRYLRCSVQAAEDKLYSSNYIGEGILAGAYPPGSAVEITMYSPQRVDLRVNKIPHQMFPVEGQFSTDVGAFLAKYFVDSPAALGLEAKGGGAAAEDTGNPLADPSSEVPEGEADHSDVDLASPDDGRGWRLDLMKPGTAQSVKQGIAAVGMTKEQVYMAFGPPVYINFDTPAVGMDLKSILDANRWVYYSGWAAKTFTVGLAGKKVYTFDGTSLVQVQ